MGDSLQRSDKVCPLKIFRIVGPQVLELLREVELAKLVEHIAHQARLADSFLHLVEALLYNFLAANDAGNRAGGLTK